MHSRRDFLKLSLATAAVIPVAMNANAFKASANDLEFHAVFESEFEQSAKFADSFSKKHEINGDITDFYYDVIRNLSQKQAVVGVVSPTTYFVLERMLFDKGFVPYFRTDLGGNFARINASKSNQKLLEFAFGNSETLTQAVKMVKFDRKFTTCTASCEAGEKPLVSFLFASRSLA